MDQEQQNDINEAENQANTVTPPDDGIPAQYRGLPSEVVEELWEPGANIDSQKATLQSEQRIQALATLRDREVAEEANERSRLGQSFVKLPEALQIQLETARQEAQTIIADYIKSSGEIQNLRPQDQFVLDKLRTIWQESQRENPGSAQDLRLQNPYDQAVFQNLVDRVAFTRLVIRQENADQQAADQVRESIGIPKQTEQTEKPAEQPRVEQIVTNETAEFGDLRAKAEEKAVVERLIASGVIKPEHADLIRQSTEEFNDTFNVARKLAGFIYSELRNARYERSDEVVKNYDNAYKLATSDTTLPFRKENGWVYRGLIGEAAKGLNTVTRGSLNVQVSPELVAELDDLVKSGEIKANYKFPDENQKGDVTKRHDSVSIYFLEQPTQEALDKLSEIATKHLRGNDLLGKKISEGFYMSEIGSVTDQQAVDFIQSVRILDPELGKAMESALTSRNLDENGKQHVRIAMSEGQYYAVKQALSCYGVEMNYEFGRGISVRKIAA